jgi:hypothetical protein
MDELKNGLSYQVFFTSNPASSEKNLFLTFFFKGQPIAIPDDKNLLPLLSKATQIAENSFRIPNIVEVSSNAEYDLSQYYSSFFCVLFSDKRGKRKDANERGLLVGKSVHSGYFLIGIWPYPFFLEVEEEMENVVSILKDVSSAAKNYSRVLLLTEK